MEILKRLFGPHIKEETEEFIKSIEKFEKLDKKMFKLLKKEVKLIFDLKKDKPENERKFIKDLKKESILIPGLIKFLTELKKHEGNQLNYLHLLGMRDRIRFLR